MKYQFFAEGPYATKYNFVLYPDGRTRSDVDLGTLGGETTATAKWENDGKSLTTYLTKKGKRDLFMTATRTINPGIFFVNYHKITLSAKYIAFLFIKRYFLLLKLFLSF